MLKKVLLLPALAAVTLFSCKKKSTVVGEAGSSGDSEPLFSLNADKVHAKVVKMANFQSATTAQTAEKLAKDLNDFTNTSRTEALARRFPVETRDGILNIETKSLTKDSEGFATFVEFTKPIPKGATVIVTVVGNLGATGTATSGSSSSGSGSSKASSVLAAAVLLRETLPSAGVDGKIDLMGVLGPFGRFQPLADGSAKPGDAGEVMGQTVITVPFLPQASAGVLFAVGKSASAPGWAIGNMINMAIIVNFENRTTVQRLTISAVE